MLVDAAHLSVCGRNGQRRFHNVSHFYCSCKCRTCDFVNDAVISLGFYQRVVTDFACNVCAHRNLGYRVWFCRVCYVHNEFVCIVGELDFDFLVTAEFDEMAAANPMGGMVVFGMVAIGMVGVIVVAIGMIVVAIGVIVVAIGMIVVAMIVVGMIVVGMIVVTVGMVVVTVGMVVVVMIT